MRRSVASTSSGVSPGRMRQLTVAVARCGSAFSACPPAIIVGTQVVRKSALKRADSESLAIAGGPPPGSFKVSRPVWPTAFISALADRSEEHTSELQSQSNLVCRLLLEKKKNKKTI